MVQKEVEKVKKAEKEALKNIDDAEKKKEWMIKKAEEKASLERDMLISKVKIDGEKLKKKTEEEAKNEAENIKLDAKKDAKRMEEKAKEKIPEAVDYAVKKVIGG